MSPKLIKFLKATLEYFKLGTYFKNDPFTGNTKVIDLTAYIFLLSSESFGPGLSKILIVPPLQLKNFANLYGCGNLDATLIHRVDLESIDATRNQIIEII